MFRLPRHLLVVRNLFFTIALLACSMATLGQDLAEIKERGTLRHLGVPYANFVTGGGDGLDVEIVKLFARHLGVRYEYVEADWNNVIQDLIGRDIVYKPTVQEVGSRPIRGDIIANGLTILPNRMTLIDYSVPTFPSAVWLLARADYKVTPIKPSGNLAQDIEATKAKLASGSTFVMDNSCIDPRLHGIEGKGFKLLRFTGSMNVNDIVPAVLKKESDMTLLDFPDILVALEKWPGRIKIIGPISDQQRMAAGFRKSSPALRQEFNQFLSQIQRDGTYMKLVEKYYPSARRYLPGYFDEISSPR
jgi:ABC-type amino acid transport substrate-binding protein